MTETKILYTVMFIMCLVVFILGATAQPLLIRGRYNVRETVAFVAMICAVVGMLCSLAAYFRD